MKPTTSSKVLVNARMENLYDLWGAERGMCCDSGVRRVEVTNAVVDIESAGLMLPRRLLVQLGLEPLGPRLVRTAVGTLPRQMYRAVRLTGRGRDCITDVTEAGDEVPVTIGREPLLMLDWAVDPKGQKLIGNPEHGGEHMLDAF